MKNRYFIALLCMAIGYTSCEFDYELEEIPHTKQMVINSLISPQENIHLNLHWSQRVDDDSYEIDVNDNYEVHLYEDDIFIDKVSVGNGYASFNHRPKAGSKYKIIIPNGSPNGDIEAETYVPNCAQSVSVEYLGSTLLNDADFAEDDPLFITMQLNEVIKKENSRALWIKCTALYEYKDEANDIVFESDPLTTSYYSNNGFIDSFNLNMETHKPTISGNRLYYPKAIRVASENLSNALPLSISFITSAYRQSSISFPEFHWQSPIDIPIT